MTYKPKKKELHEKSPELAVYKATTPKQEGDNIPLIGPSYVHP